MYCFQLLITLSLLTILAGHPIVAADPALAGLLRSALTDYVTDGVLSPVLVSIHFDFGNGDIRMSWGRGAVWFTTSATTTGPGRTS